jgi:hypothetical protein
MPSDLWLWDKGFMTLTTLIGLLSSVNNLMHGEVWLPSKGFILLIALTGLLLSVNYLMLGEACLAAKGFSTLITLIGLLPSVNYFLFEEVWFFHIDMAFPQCESSHAQWGMNSRQRFYHTECTYRASPQCELSHAWWGLISGKRFSTLITLIGFLTSTHPLRLNRAMRVLTYIQLLGLHS